MQNRAYQKPVLMIGLDAAEPRLIEQWTEDGTLPNLKSLREQGAYGRLASSADWLTGSPWPTFYTSTSPADHGVYHFLQWHAGQMVPIRPTVDWLPLQPFWRNFGENDPRVVAIDIPVTYPPTAFNGVEICGWASHDRMGPPASHPASLVEQVRKDFGPSPIHEEIHGLQSPKSLLQLRDRLVQATDRVAGLAKGMMDREAWDLFMVTFGATHRGGHKLWDHTGTAGILQPDDEQALSTALRDVYIACDAAVGQLIETAGNEVTCLVFSLHGMDVNTSRVDLLPTMLDRILNPSSNVTDEEKEEGYLQRIRELVPLEWRHNVKRRLPIRLQDTLTRFWRTRSVDWATTPAVSLVADLHGYIRINLSGRETAGIVEPGQEYDELCTKIIEGLKTFVDADTGQPVVNDIIRSDHYFCSGSRRDLLPDLIVKWSFSPAAEHRSVTSPQFGSIAWPTPSRNPDGRSGNHRPEGFLLAAGANIQPKDSITGATITDLAPTVHALLGVPQPAEMQGNMIPAVVSNKLGIPG